MAKTNESGSPSKINRVFRTKSTAGPYPKGHVFDENDFRRVHPAPPDVDADEYHSRLIDRLLSSTGTNLPPAIEVVADPSTVTPEPAPPGSHPTTLAAVVNTAAPVSAADATVAAPVSPAKK